MPNPITAPQPAPRGAPRPRWGVPTGGALPFWEAKALRARKDVREETRAELRSVRSGGDRRDRRWTGAPGIVHRDQASTAALTAKFTSTLRNEYAATLRMRGVADGSIPAVAPSRLNQSTDASPSPCDLTLPSPLLHADCVFRKYDAPRHRQ